MNLLYSKQYDNLLTQIFHSFSQQLIGDVAAGMLNGYIRFDSFNSLKFTTNASLSAGIFTLYVIRLCSVAWDNQLLRLTFSNSTLFGFQRGAF
jgi:hypothetical protein